MKAAYPVSIPSCEQHCVYSGAVAPDPHVEGTHNDYMGAPKELILPWPQADCNFPAGLKHSAAQEVQCTGCSRNWVLRFVLGGVIRAPLCSAGALGPELPAVRLVPRCPMPCCELPQLKRAERTKKTPSEETVQGAGSW